MWSIVSSLVCNNAGTVDLFELRCECDHVPHYNDNRSCSTCVVDPRQGTCIDDNLAKYGTGVKCKGKWHGPVCTDCNTVDENGCGSRCKQGYYGDKCHVQCDAATKCSGHGQCNSLGDCQCDSGWHSTAGELCNAKCGKDFLGCVHPEATCSSGSFACICPPGITGHWCQCKNNCVHGTPDTEQCDNTYHSSVTSYTCIPNTCAATYHGPDCDKECNCGACPECENTACQLDPSGATSDYGCQCLQAPNNTLAWVSYDRCKENRISPAQICEDDMCLGGGQCSADLTECVCRSRGFDGTLRPTCADPDGHDCAWLGTPNATQTTVGCGICKQDYNNKPIWGNEDLINPLVACVFYCDDTVTCNGHGKCVVRSSDTACDCDVGWDDFTGCSTCKSEYYPKTGDDMCTKKCTRKCEDALLCPQGAWCDVDRQQAASLTDDNVNCRHCNGNGECTGDGTCQCDATYYAPANDCSHECTQCDQDKGNCVYDTTTGSFVCMCYDGYFGEHCTVTCSKQDQSLHFCSGDVDVNTKRCTDGSAVQSKKCNGQPCRAYPNYIDDNGRDYNFLECTSKQDCTSYDLDKFPSADPTVFCEPRSKEEGMIYWDEGTDTYRRTVRVGRFCKKVLCDCSDSLYGGTGCQLLGCDDHTWLVDIENEGQFAHSSTCGRLPMQGSVSDCPRGDCVPTTGHLGMRADNPAPSSEDPLGTCKCRQSTSRACDVHRGSQAYRGACCAEHEQDVTYFGTNCMGECGCVHPHKGYCNANDVLGGTTCTCRSGFDSELYASTGPLFWGTQCTKQCPGIVKINHGTDVRVVNESTAIDDAAVVVNRAGCPPDAQKCGEDACPGCHVDLTACSNAGRCTSSGHCICPSLSSAVLDGYYEYCTSDTRPPERPDRKIECVFLGGISHDISGVNVAGGDACEHTCPVTRYMTTDTLRAHFVEYETYLRRAYKEDELGYYADHIFHVDTFMKMYKKTMCNGHGWCDTTSLNNDRCNCDSGWGLDDCSQQCNMPKDVENALKAYIDYDNPQELAQTMDDFGLSICGAHASCRPLTDSNRVNCQCNEGGNFSAATLDTVLPRVTAFCNKHFCDANYTAKYLAPALIGDCGDCQVGYFTLKPATGALALPALGRWNVLRTCDARCVTQSTEPYVSQCCEECYESDWDALLNPHEEAAPGAYGGCKPGKCPLFATGKNCSTCLYGFASYELDAYASKSCTERRNEHMGQCAFCGGGSGLHRKINVYPQEPADVDKTAYLPGCVECLGTPTSPCNGKGACKGLNWTSSLLGASGDMYRSSDYVALAAGEHIAYTGICICDTDVAGPDCSDAQTTDSQCSFSFECNAPYGQCINGNCVCTDTRYNPDKKCKGMHDWMKEAKVMANYACMQYTQGSSTSIQDAQTFGTQQSSLNAGFITEAIQWIKCEMDSECQPAADANPCGV